MRVMRFPVVPPGQGFSRSASSADPKRFPGRPFVNCRHWNRASERTACRNRMTANTGDDALYAASM
jgi:hypothetical protein